MHSEITREVLEHLLREDPDTTHKKLADILGCNPKTVAKRLKSFGMNTRPWSERTHSDNTKERIAKAREGKFTGESNPNFGLKSRPWLDGDASPLRQWHKSNPDFGAKQRGASNPVHKVAHLYQDPEYVARITRGLRAHTNERRGSTYEKVYGHAKALVYKQKLREASPVRLSKFSRGETEPERLVRVVLEGLGVSFKTQVPIGPYTVDFFVPTAHLVLQSDGDYWHAHPDQYGENKKPLTPSQRSRRRLDASCDSYMLQHGYRVLRLWECDLHDDLENCRDRILQALGDSYGQ